MKNSFSLRSCYFWVDSWPRLHVLAHLHFLLRLKRKGHGLSAEKWPRDWSQNMGLGCEAGGRGGAGSRVGGVLAGREAGLMLLVLSQALDTGTVGTSSVSLPDLQSVLGCVLSRAHSSCLLPSESTEPDSWPQAYMEPPVSPSAGWPLGTTRKRGCGTLGSERVSCSNRRFEPKVY